MKEVSPKIYNKLRKHKIDIERCKECGYSPEVVVAYPWYGGTGAKVRCGHCGAKAKLHNIAMCIVNSKDGSLATPVTRKSMMDGIMAAIEDWNQRMIAE